MTSVKKRILSVTLAVIVLQLIWPPYLYFDAYRGQNLFERGTKEIDVTTLSVYLIIILIIATIALLQPDAMWQRIWLRIRRKG